MPCETVKDFCEGFWIIVRPMTLRFISISSVSTRTRVIDLHRIKLTFDLFEKPHQLIQLCVYFSYGNGYPKQLD